MTDTLVGVKTGSRWWLEAVLVSVIFVLICFHYPFIFLNCILSTVFVSLLIITIYRRSRWKIMFSVVSVCQSVSLFTGGSPCRPVQTCSLANPPTVSVPNLFKIVLLCPPSQPWPCPTHRNLLCPSLLDVFKRVHFGKRGWPLAERPSYYYLGYRYFRSLIYL